MFRFTAISKQQTKAVFDSGNALGKTVRTLIDDDRNWRYVLQQIADPQHYRPVKSLDKTIDRSRSYNFLLQRWEDRKITSERGRPKDTLHSKKISTTLLPIDGCIHLYSHGEYLSLGLVLDLTKCNLKQEKYIFIERVNTDKKPWLRQKNISEENQILPKTISLADLKALLVSMRAEDVVPELNELLLGLAREAVVGVFARNNHFIERLAAYRQRALIKEMLAISVPVLLLQPDAAYEFIDDATIEKDILLALTLNQDHPGYSLAQKYVKEFPLFLLQSKQRNDAFSWVMQYLTLDEQKQLSLSHANTVNLDNIQYYATFSLQKREKNEALQWVNLLNELAQPSLTDFAVKHQFQSADWIETLRLLAKSDADDTDAIFKKLAYYASQHKIVEMLKLIHDSVSANKAVLPRIDYLIFLMHRQVVNDLPVMLLLVTFASKQLLLALNMRFIVNTHFQQQTSIRIYVQVERGSYNEVYYDKKLEKSFEISFLTLVSLNQSDEIAHSLLSIASDKAVKRTLQDLKLLRDVVEEYGSDKRACEWCWIAKKKITPDQLTSAYTKILKQIYFYKKDIWLDKYEKRVLESLLIKTIAAMPTKQRLSHLMANVWIHPIVNQRRHGLFDQVTGKKELRIKDNLLDAAESVMKMR